MSSARSYHYHASAHGLSGHIVRPGEHLIEVQAGTTLPSTGGVGQSRVENFRYRDMVSFRLAYSQVSGSEKVENNKTIHYTVAMAVVEGLNILDVVTADRIVARLTSRYESGEESRILVLGSRFENLRIAGYEVDVELDHKLAKDELGTFEAVKKKFQSDKEFRRMAGDPLNLEKFPTKLEAHGAVHCSLVKQVTPKEYPGITSHGRRGHVLAVEDFGKIYLAEMLLEHGSKTLTMVRIELGSPQAGGFLVAQGGTNGLPPHG